MLQRHQDAKLAADIEDKRSDLAKARSGDDPADIEAKRAALDAAFQAAIKTLTDRRTDVLVTLQTARNFVLPLWQLPPSMGAAVRAAAAHVESVRAMLEVDKVSDAAAELDRIRIGAAGSIAPAARAWARCVKAALTAVGQSRGLSDVAQGIVGAAKLQLTAALGAAGSLVEDASYNALTDGMRNISLAYASSQSLFDQLSTAIKTDVASAIALLRAKQLKDPTTLDALNVKAGAVARLLSASSGDCDPQAPALSTALDALDDAWRQASAEQLEPSQRAEVDSELAAQRYRSAATKTASALADAPRPPQFAPQHVTVPLARATAEGAAQPEGAPEPAGVASPNWVPSDLQKFDSVNMLRKVKGRQTLLLGALMCLFGYGLYEPKFVGTLSDFSSVVFWAFGIDLSVEAVLRLTKKS